MFIVPFVAKCYRSLDILLIFKMNLTQNQIEFESLMICEDCGELFRHGDMHYYWTSEGRKCK